MDCIKVLIADDHAVVRSGLRLLLNGQEDIEVLGEAESGQEAVDKAIALRPDIVLMDISMQGLNGLEATRQLQQFGEGYPAVLILTMHQNEEYFFQALRSGALGYVPKSAPDTEVLFAIRTVADRRSYIHPSVAHLLVNDYLERSRDCGEQDSMDNLTEREREILQLVAMGFSNKEIAQKLSISIHTVHNHRSRLMEKLGLHDRMEILKYAIRKHILDI